MNSKPTYLIALEALRNREALFRILLFTLVTVVFWIGFSIFFSQQRTKVEPNTQEDTIPLNPYFNADILTELEARRAFFDPDLENFPIYDRVISDDRVSRLIIAGSEEQEVIQAPAGDDDLVFDRATPSSQPVGETDTIDESSAPTSTETPDESDTATDAQPETTEPLPDTASDGIE
jgi:hypothetical protein